jgi:hypothetical protein
MLLDQQEIYRKVDFLQPEFGLGFCWAARSAMSSKRLVALFSKKCLIKKSGMDVSNSKVAWCLKRVPFLSGSITQLPL